MISDTIVISGTGCALADYLYTGINFNGTAFLKFQSKQPGDGGLSPGKLVFTEELEKFSALGYQEIFMALTGGRRPNSINVGGPGLVSLINTSQLLDPDQFKIRYYGGIGNDSTADFILSLMKKTPLDFSNYIKVGDKFTPFTHVLSDPSYDNNHGERTFINNIGAAWDYTPEFLDEDFFKSDIVCFGGTALVPQIHDNLTDLLRKSRQHNCVTVVNTVFDFRNEKRNPGKRWPLVDSDDSFELIDLLIMDCEESLRISGCLTIEQAAGFFMAKNVSSFIITNGTKNIFAYSNGKIFDKCDLFQLPVSPRIAEKIKLNPELHGDTTGCGDNFAGGAIAAIALQMKTRKPGHLDLKDTLSWAIASGGFACFYMGGTYIEKNPGEKLSKVLELVVDYNKILGWL